MQDLVDDLEQVVGAPLLVVLHDIVKNAIHFLNHIHLNHVS